jgi:integrase
VAAEYKRADTVDELLDLFLEKHPRPQSSWTKECRRIFSKDVRPLIGGMKLPDVGRSHVRQIVDTVRGRGATVTVNRTLAALRRAFSWAVSKDLMSTNPALNLATDVEESPKDRTLDAQEIRSLWQGLDAGVMGTKSALALRLILVTGQRPGEVCGARRSELDLNAGMWLISSSRAKNRQDHLVPLSDLAKTCFRAASDASGNSEYLFPSRPRKGAGLGGTCPMQSHALSHAMRNALKALGLADNPATPHDLRRTVATHMARIGIADSHVGRVLNHGTELRRTITSRVYIRHDFLTEKRQALDAWAQELERILGGPSHASIVIGFQRLQSP